MPNRPSTSISNLQQLLALARALLQATDLHSMLNLIGPAIPKLLLSDRTLLLVFTGNQEYTVAFDNFGSPHHVDTGSALYKYARQATLNSQLHTVVVEPSGFHAIQITNRPDLPHVSVLVVPFPWVNPIGALVIEWSKKKRQQFLIKRIAILNHMAELVSAALSNLHSRQELEKQIQLQDKELTKANKEHANEMLRRDRIEEEIHHISITDVMTGLRNRRGFFLQAEQGFKVARRQRLTSAVVFADVDGLKLVNDGLGHEVGDQLIRDSADVLQRSFRSSDVISRFGGDEFAVFTLDAANTDAIVGRIKERIHEFNCSSSRPYQVAFSIGIVRCDPVSNLNLADYLLMADTQMYAKKKEHRSEKLSEKLIQ